MKNVNILIIATHKKYYDFALDLIKSMKKYFLIDHNVKYFLFTDMKDPKIKNVIHIYTKHRPWPGSTLLRFHIFLEHENLINNCDYIYYIDADMKVIKPIGDEIFSERTNVMHVGFYDKPKKEWVFERSNFSDSYIPINEGDMYYHATFFGGTKDNMISMFKTIKEWTENDLLKGFFPIFHDESFLNKFLYLNPPTKILDPGYAFFYHWKNDAPFEPKIININKNESSDIINLHCEQSNFLYDEIMNRIKSDKYDLSDTTIVFFVKDYSKQKLENLITIIKYINKHFTCNFLIVEINNYEKFYLYDLDENIEFKKLFIKSEKYDIINNLNFISKTVNTEFMILHNTEDLIQLDSYINSRYCIKNNYCDFMYLHNGIKVKVNLENYESFKKNLSITAMNISSSVNSVRWNVRNQNNKIPCFPLITRTNFFKDFKCDLKYSTTNCQYLYIKKWIERNNLKYFYNFQFYFELDTSNYYNSESTIDINKDTSLINKYFDKHVTILLSVHNNINTIKCCLFSIINQTHRNFDVIIMDRYSTDGSYEEIKEFEKKYDNIRCIRYYKDINKLNSLKIMYDLIDFNKTDYIMVSDPYCISYDYKIQCLIESLNDNPTIDAVGSFVNYCNTGTFKTECMYENIFNNFHNIQYINTNSAIIKSNVFKIILSLSDNNCYDYLFWMNFLMDGYKVINIPKVLSDVVYNEDIKTNELIKYKNVYKNYVDSIHMNNKKNVGIVIIATNNYIDLANKLIESINKYFLKNHKVDIFLFTNRIKDINHVDNVKSIYQEHLGFPAMTLFRYKIINNNKDLFSNYDYLYYMDSDYECVSDINEEIFGNLVGVNHPSLWNKNNNQFTYERNNNSLAYIKDGEGKVYYYGAFQGGVTKHFLKMCETLNKNINIDLQNKIIAKWWDESHLNRYFIDNCPDVTLDASYSYIDSDDNKIFNPKMKCIYKDNNNIRESSFNNIMNSCDKEYDVNKIKPFINTNKFNDCLEDLKNVSFIFTIDVKSKDNLENLELVINNIRYYFNTNIFIGDYSKNDLLYNYNSDFKKNYFKFGKDYTNLKIINDLVKKTNTDIICIHNSDCLISKESIDLSIILLKDKIFDIVIAHNGICKKVPRSYYNLIKNTKKVELFDNNYIQIDDPDDIYKYSGCLFMYKNIFENSNSILDEKERYIRFTQNKDYKYCHLNDNKFLYKMNSFNPRLR